MYVYTCTHTHMVYMAHIHIYLVLILGGQCVLHGPPVTSHDLCSAMMTVSQWTTWTGQEPVQSTVLGVLVVVILVLKAWRFLGELLVISLYCKLEEAYSSVHEGM